MKISYSNHFELRLKKRIGRSKKLRKNIKSKLKLLQMDIHSQGLKTHKLKGKRIDQYSFWVEGNLRIVFIRLSEEEILLTDIINHDEY